VGRRGRGGPVLDVDGDIRKYEAELAKIPGVTEKEAKEAADRFVKATRRGQLRAVLEAERAAEDVGKAWGDIGTLITANLSTAAIQAAATGLFNYTDALFDARSETINLAEATGISLEVFAGLEVAAARANIPIEQITGSFEDFGEILFDAANGTGRAVEAFDILGFTQEELRDGLDDVSGTLVEVIRRFSESEEGALKNAAGQGLFGDASNRLTAALNGVPLDDYIASARALGTVLDEEAVANTRAWSAATGELTLALQGTTGAIADSAPVIFAVEALTVGLVTITTAAGIAIEETGNRFVDAAENIKAFLTLDFENFQGPSAVIADIADDFDRLFNESLAAGRAIVETREALKETGGVAGNVSRAFEELAITREKAAKEAKEAAKEAATARAKALRDAEREAAKAAKRVKEQISAGATLSDIFATSTEDRLDDFGKIDRAQTAELARLREVELVLGENAATAAAGDAIRERSTRERAAIQLGIEEEVADGVKQVLADIDEFDRDIAEQRIERDQQRLDFGLDIFGQLSGAATAFFELQLQQEQELAQATAERLRDEVSQRDRALRALDRIEDSALDQNLARREELQRQIEALSEDEVNTALAADLLRVESAIAADLRQLDSAIARSEQTIANEQDRIDRLFKQAQALEISSATISGASAALAAFAPPPLGAGPIAGAFLAAAIAANTAGTIAKISSQSPPQFHAGGFTTGPDEQVVTQLSGEATLNTRAVQDIGREGVNDINAGAQTPREPMRVVLEVSGRNLGMAVVDELNTGRELSRTMKRIARVRSSRRPVYSNG